MAEVTDHHFTVSQVKKARDRLDPAFLASRAMEEAAYETYMLQGEHELK